MSRRCVSAVAEDAGAGEGVGEGACHDAAAGGQSTATGVPHAQGRAQLGAAEHGAIRRPD